MREKDIFIIIILALLIVLGILLSGLNSKYDEGLEDGIKKTISYIINESKTEGHIALRDPETQEVTQLIEFEYSTEICAKACVGETIK